MKLRGLAAVAALTLAMATTAFAQSTMMHHGMMHHKMMKHHMMHHHMMMPSRYDDEASYDDARQNDAQDVVLPRSKEPPEECSSGGFLLSVQCASAAGAAPRLGLRSSSTAGRATTKVRPSRIKALL